MFWTLMTTVSNSTGAPNVNEVTLIVDDIAGAVFFKR